MRISFLRPALMTAAIVASAGILAGGLALRPAFAVGGTVMVGPFSVTHCTQSAPCKAYSNAGTGPGLRGINTNASSAGAGLIGTATLNGTGVAGVANAGPGVTGTSAGGLGVTGFSSSSVGIEGSSSSSFGVIGATSAASAPIAGVQGNNGASTIAVRANGFGGQLFVGNNSSSVDVFTVDNGGNVGIAGSTGVTGNPGVDALDAGTSGSSRGVGASGFEGMAGFGDGAGPFGVVGFNSATSGGDALAVQDLAGTGVLVNGFDSSNTLKLQIQDDGSIFAHAFIVAFDTPSGNVKAYATTSSTPNMEDFGEAQLTAGQTYVSLKRAFATAIDSRYSYMVFITPEGDTRGLYVTQKTPAGFVVRENQGGRSEAAFSYRIVAKPYGSTASAIHPSIAPPHQRTQLPTMATLHRVPKTKM